MVGGLVCGSDVADFGGGGKAGEAELICKAIFDEGVFDGGDGEGVVCGVSGCGAKQAANASDGVVLGHLEVS